MVFLRDVDYHFLVSHSTNTSNKLHTFRQYCIRNISDFGEVQEILGEHVITQKGTVAKDRFYFPKNLIKRFDGDTVYFKITKDESKQYKRNY
jgi:hypothetical protein